MAEPEQNVLSLPGVESKPAKVVHTAPRAQSRKYGRSGHGYTFEGKKLLGVTTVIKNSIPAQALVGWAARTVAETVANRRDILMDMSDAEIIDFLQGAPNRERDAAANRGTEVHRLAQQLAQGEEVEVPEELRGHVESYVKFLDTWDPTEAVVERPIFNPTYRYAGTMDLLCRIERENLGRCLLDIKTNRSGPFGETGLQLGAYGHGEFYVSDQQVEVPMPPIDNYLCVWVRADGYDLIPFTVDEDTWRCFQHCLFVAWFVQNRLRDLRGDAIWIAQEVPTK